MLKLNGIPFNGNGLFLYDPTIPSITALRQTTYTFAATYNFELIASVVGGTDVKSTKYSLMIGCLLT